MAEDGLRISGLSSGLAVLLDGEDSREGSQRARLVSCCNDFGDQSVDRTLEHIFDLPYKTINTLTSPVDTGAVSSIIRNQLLKNHVDLGASIDRNRVGVSSSVGRSGLQAFGIEESSVCGDIRIVKPPLLLESHALFSSARASACVWKGRWMYEVTLETCGVQQLGWATLSCPFTDHRGVGDADDSYAYDGKRVCKWSKEAEPYGQSWVVGDVIGCCINLDLDEISFYRNGVPLGVAFRGIRKMVPGLGYYPAISLSQGERCELNFGAYPFKFPIDGFLPIQSPPLVSPFAARLLRCLSRLLELQHTERSGSCSAEKLRILKRFVSFEDIFIPVSRAICKELLSAIAPEPSSAEYIARGPLLSFIVEIFKVHPPHDYTSLDRVLDCFQESEESRLLLEYLIAALSSACKTAPWVLSDLPYSGPYIYLTLACHILRRDEIMIVWWKSADFEFIFEGFLSRKVPNKQDLQSLMPSVWWPGSCEDMPNESSMFLTTTALAEAINVVEEKHRDLCCLVIQFIPPIMPPQLPGSVFKKFLQNLLLKNRGADRNLAPPGVSTNSVLVSLFNVILHFLSEGSVAGRVCGWIKDYGIDSASDVGFLHRDGKRGFCVGLFLRNDPHRIDFSRLGGSYDHLAKSYPTNDEQEQEVIQWDEGFLDDEETRATHSGWRKPCCCSGYDIDFARVSKNRITSTTKGSRGHGSSIQERSAHVSGNCSTGNLSDEMEDKPGTSDHYESEFTFRPVQHTRILPRESTVSSSMLKEEELLDAMLLLYHLGVAPNFKQASTYIARQSQSISLLEETDRQIRERVSGEQVKRLKEARSVYREEVLDCVRLCTWYRISLSSRWKQRAMYALCVWIVHLLLNLSKVDYYFIYTPEYYLETLVDCFHVLRRSDPPFVPASIFIKQGLASFVTFVVSHFNDPRISSPELKDLLLQSISVLVRYKEFLAVFESNEAAKQRLPRAILSVFDNRTCVPVTNILMRLTKSTGFGSSKLVESSSSSVVFQNLLRDACIHDEDMFSAFLNRLFNTLSWAMTEFSVTTREMQENYQATDFNQRKCSVIFDLSCNLAKVLEFFTHTIPQTFLVGPDTNIRRLTELIIFILNHMASAADPEIFDLSVRRPGQSPEKVNGGMILAPLAGIILNLLDTSKQTDYQVQNDIVGIFISMDCPDIVLRGFYLLECNWTGYAKGDEDIAKLKQLDKISSLLVYQMDSEKVGGEVAAAAAAYGGGGGGGESTDKEDNTCCICYASESDARFVPCMHVSCFGCISRHLLNCQRCFFCNAIVTEVTKGVGNNIYTT